jgi:hypothetical protein
MKTYTRFLDVPTRASYLGSEEGDGFMSEELADYVDAANEPARYKDAEGVSHYFDLN